MSKVDQEMSESDSSKIDSENNETPLEEDTNNNDDEKHNESSSSDDTEQESPVIVGSEEEEEDEDEEEEDEENEEEDEENEDEEAEIYLVYVDGNIKGYHDTEESAQDYIKKLAKGYKKSYDNLYPGWTAWTIYLEEFYSTVRIMTRYNLFIMNYDRVEHVFRYRAVSKLPFWKGAFQKDD